MSKKINTQPASNASKKKYHTPKLKAFSPLVNLDSLDLPAPIFKLLSQPIKTAHFAAIIPNASAAVVTQATVAEIPPGFTVVLVFDEQPMHGLPDKHNAGNVYIID